MVALGLSCGRYTTIVCSVVAFASPVVGHELRKRKDWGLSFAFALAAIRWIWLLSVNGIAAFGGNSQQPMVEPNTWSFDGPVMLTNLDHARDWQSEELSLRFPVLQGDRWETHSHLAAAYSRAVADLRTGKREFYLLDDLSTGGYRDFVDKHNVVAIVVDSQSIDTIRQLSVDVQWRVMSIDAKRTIFGSSAAETTALQTRRAGRLMMQMEWPRPGVNIQMDGVLALGMKDESNRVAMVLNAVRLPYAAMRVLGDDHSSAAELTRTWSYVELAHRSRRHTGRVSLIDQYRAVSRLKAIQSSTVFMSRDEALRVERALVSLNGTGASTHDAHTEREQPELEHAIRSELGLGQTADTDVLIKEIKNDSIRKFYNTLRSANVKTPLEIARELEEIAKNDTLPVYLREECLFYVGCLWLEIGEVSRAPQQLRASRKINPNSSLTGLRAHYLSQISHTPSP